MEGDSTDGGGGGSSGGSADAQFVDNPREVDEFLSSTGAALLTWRDVRNLAHGSTNGRSNTTTTHIDDLLSKELLQMSIQDRNTIYEEIHGVQTLAPTETPALIQTALAQLATELMLVHPAHKVAYERSRQHRVTYINTAEFRLRFLRCELFDAKKAAIRMVHFLDLLLEVFGEYALQRPIQMTDFNRDEMVIFRSGLQQLLPYRDRSGRRLYASVGGFNVRTPLISRVKILLYTLYTASEDVETQKMGIASIVWPGSTKNTTFTDDTTGINLDKVIFMKRVYENLPVRTCSIHMCLPDTPFYQMMKSIMILTMSTYRKRMKFHVGETIELRYSLKGYGIPVELVPLTDTGNVKTSYLKQWMKVRRILEVRKMAEEQQRFQEQLHYQQQQESSFDDLFNDDTDTTSINTMTSTLSMPSPQQPLEAIIECPRSHDVVFRSGTSMACHPGNVRFRCLIELKHEDAYLISSTTQAELAEQLIHEITMNGGRFLKWDNHGYWTGLQDRVQIHTKVALSIRDYKYKTKAQRNRQTNQSCTFLFQDQDGNKRRKTNNNKHAKNLCNRQQTTSSHGSKVKSQRAVRATAVAIDTTPSSSISPSSQQQNLLLHQRLQHTHLSSGPNETTAEAERIETNTTLNASSIPQPQQQQQQQKRRTSWFGNKNS